ncbi:MAG TPA: DUF1963 domain-containing protein [Xanthomonadaceae bacterium]
MSRSTGKPMRFIGQVALDASVFPGAGGKIAYVFMTEEDEWVDSTWEPDGGENAVVIQPGGKSIAVEISHLVEGPTLFRMIEIEGASELVVQACEFAVKTQPVENAEFQPETDRTDWSTDAFETYMSALEGNKIGGTPAFLQGDEFPEGNGWRLLLQLDSTQVPFFVNFGDAGVGYAFVDANATSARFLWQCA